MYPNVVQPSPASFAMGGGQPPMQPQGYQQQPMMQSPQGYQQPMMQQVGFQPQGYQQQPMLQQQMTPLANITPSETVGAIINAANVPVPYTGMGNDAIINQVTHIIQALIGGTMVTGPLVAWSSDPMAGGAYMGNKTLADRIGIEKIQPLAMNIQGLGFMVPVVTLTDIIELVCLLINNTLTLIVERTAADATDEETATIFKRAIGELKPHDYVNAGAMAAVYGSFLVDYIAEVNHILDSAGTDKNVAKEEFAGRVADNYLVTLMSKGERDILFTKINCLLESDKVDVEMSESELAIFIVNAMS